MDVREVWNRLGGIRRLGFESRLCSAAKTGWSGSGRGDVRVEPFDAVTLLFHEAGAWTPAGGREITFHNLFRWTRDPDCRLIRLEHLRFGPDSPVYLFDLVPLSERVLASAEPHVCRDDRYSARLELGTDAVRLSWTVTGPKKDEWIAYTYW